MQTDAERRSRKPGPPATDNPGDQHGRHEKKVERLVAERRADQGAYNESKRDQTERQQIAGGVCFSGPTFALSEGDT